jgi:ADP-ribose pyrophosphatase YjhB (NUDIX family)
MPLKNKSLIEQIKKLKTPLPEEIFNALNKLVPFAACEIAVVNKEGVLLTFRQDKFWKGWHFPGSIIRSGESFADVLKRTAKKELGSALKSFEFLLPMNYPKGARGHSISFVFLCRLKGKPRKGKFFSKMPESIIKEHKELFKKLTTLI